MASNAGGNVAHLDGAFFGVMLVLRTGRRNLVGWLEWLLDAWLTRSLAISMEAQPVPGFHVQPTGSVKNAEASRAPMSDDEFNAARADRQERLDAILDKISKHGYDHLSAEEKRLCLDESQRLTVVNPSLGMPKISGPAGATASLLTLFLAVLVLVVNWRSRVSVVGFRGWRRLADAMAGLMIRAADLASGVVPVDSAAFPLLVLVATWPSFMLVLWPGATAMPEDRRKRGACCRSTFAVWTSTTG